MTIGGERAAFNIQLIANGLKIHGEGGSEAIS
jgi:hypothetical protein